MSTVTYVVVEIAEDEIGADPEAMREMLRRVGAGVLNAGGFSFDVHVQRVGTVSP